MPELPEVETIRAQLAPRLEGRTFSRVEILDPRLTRPHDLFEVMEELEGDRVGSVERRGKYLLLRLESGLSLLIHLRMTGSFGFIPTSHERAVLELDDGSRLAYRDVRRFGTWLVLEDAQLEPYLATKNGPEPLGSRFTASWLGQRLAVRRAPLKAVLLDQRVVAVFDLARACDLLLRSAEDCETIRNCFNKTIALIIALPLAVDASAQMLKPYEHQSASVLNIVVNTTSDTQDVNPGNGVCADSGGMCSAPSSLRFSSSLQPAALRVTSLSRRSTAADPCRASTAARR
jgi:hypothetical protein